MEGAFFEFDAVNWRKYVFEEQRKRRRNGREGSEECLLHGENMTHFPVCIIRMCPRYK